MALEIDRHVIDPAADMGEGNPFLQHERLADIGAPTGLGKKDAGDGHAHAHQQCSECLAGKG
jgi:hypothetical protein